MSLISIIIPVYNGEKYIEQCLESILRQTYTAYEIIVIDDGSVDNTFDIVSACAEKNPAIRLIHTENHGVCHARNTGLENAKGEYITFVDADDQLTETALEDMYRLIREYGAEISIMAKVYLRTDGTPDDYRTFSEKIEVWEETEILQKSIADHPASHSVYAKLYQRSLVENIRFVEGRRVHEDSFFVFECFAACKRAVYQNVGVYLYYITPGSVSRQTFSDKFFDISYFADRKTEIIQKNYPQFADQIPAIQVRANLALVYNLCKTYQKEYRPAQQECLKKIRALAKEFTPCYSFEKRFLFLIRWRLFWLYKFNLYLKMGRNKS